MLGRLAVVAVVGILWTGASLAQLQQVPGPPPAPTPPPRPAAPPPSQTPAPPPVSGGMAPGEEALYMGGFNGTWVGKMRTVDPEAFDPAIGAGKPGDEAEFAIVVAGASVKVYSRRDGSWSEVKPGAFRIAAHKTTAVVYAIDSASDVYDTTKSGGWVEAWNFTLTHKNTTVLYAARWRAVNNYLMKPSEKSARFFSGSFGELHQEPKLPD